MKSLQLIKTTKGATWALRQVNELVALGCEVHVILPDRDGIASEYVKSGASVHCLNVDIAKLVNPFLFIRSVFEFRKILKQFQPDIVHSHFVGTTLFMRIAMVGVDIPRVFQVPGPLHLEKRITRFVDLVTSSRHDFWIPTCSFTKQIYEDSGVSNRQLFLTYYGTNLDLYKPSKCRKLRDLLNVDDSVPIVGMVAYAYAPKKIHGHSRGIKGHEDLIDAMKIVLNQFPNAVLVFIGGAWDGAQSYFDSVIMYGKCMLGDSVHFLGSRSDVHDLYPGFNVVVHPSHSENLGGAAESMLMGVPTIATNIGGFPDLVIDGETGWLVPAKNPLKIADAIIKALSSPDECSVRSLKARILAEAMLDVRKTSADVYQFYNEIVESHEARI